MVPIGYPIRRDNKDLSGFKICESGKLIGLSYDEGFNIKDYDVQLFLEKILEKYKNSPLFISSEIMKNKLKEKSWFDSKRDRWYSLRNYMFESTSKGREIFIGKCGIGNSDEGIFFTSSSFFFLFNDGLPNTTDYNFTRISEFLSPFEGYWSDPLRNHVKITNRFINQDSREFRPWFSSRFKNPEITSIVEDLFSIGFSQYIYWENSILKKINENQSELLKLIDKELIQFDKDGNGLIDVIEDKDEFEKLLTKHQNSIIQRGKEFNQNYVHQFIKVNNYLKDKKINLQLMFDSIKGVDTPSELSQYVEFLEDEIHSYNLLLFNSLNLIVSLIENDQITFYNIYEKFDRLNIFTSNWEKEVSFKLSQINFNLNSLFNQINEMTIKIVNSINELTYVTEQSNRMVENRLMEIDSTIKTNNLLTLINTYQTYKVNKNTKGLIS
jgi:hypothetical protein